MNPVKTIKKAGLAAALLASVAARAQFEEFVSAGKSPVEANAVIDARAQLARVSGKVAAVNNPEGWSGKSAVIVGLPSENKLLSQYSAAVSKLDFDGFILDRKKINGAECIIVAAATHAGLANGIYALLSQAGFGFTLGAEFVPEKLNAKALRPESRSPGLGVRGFLPWHNFYNSPTVWDPVDFRAFIDDAIRMGANFIGFHNYEGEPIIAHYGKDGKLVAGGRLLSTKNENWGTHSIKAGEFGFGTSKLYSQEYFGAETTEMEDADAAIAREQEIIAEALAYAKSRGIKTCVGFDATFYAGTPIPTTEKMIQKYITRLKFLIEKYPTIDYIWIWPCEASAVSGIQEPMMNATFSEASALANYAKNQMDVFEDIAKFDKTNHPFLKKTPQGAEERVQLGVAYEHLAIAAERVFKQYKNPPKLIIAGWGGDRNLLTETYFPGWDKLLPYDVTFSALEHFFPLPRVSESYHKLSPKRQRWPIAWLENDGDQWQPQPYVKIFEGLMDKLYESGSQGVLGIHWRTRCIAENFQYLCDRAWIKSLTRELFYRRYAAKLYGGENLTETAAIHSELDMLPYRWLGGSGQHEAGRFAWGTLGDESDLRKLEQIRARAEKLSFKNRHAKSNMDWLKARIDWTLAYRRMTVKGNEAQAMIDAKQFEKAREILSDKAFPEAFRAYAKRLSTRGEHGVLATANTKAYYEWHRMYALCNEALSSDAPPPNMDWEVAPKDREILLPRRFTSIGEGENLKLEPVVLGGGDAWVFFRKLGEKNWSSQKLEPVKGWVYEATIASREIGGRGVEFKFGLSPNPDSASTPAHAAAVIPMPPATSRNRVGFAPAKTAKIAARAFKNEKFPISIKWDKAENIEYYRVLRDGELQCVTQVEYFFDVAQKERGSYVIEGVYEGRVVAKSDPVPYVMPNITITEKPSASLISNNGGVVIKIAPPKDQNAVKCLIYRSGKRLASQKLESAAFEHIEKKLKNEKGESLVAEFDVNPIESISFFDEVPEGDWKYRICFANQFRAESKSASEHSVELRRKKVDPFLNLPLTSRPEGSREAGSLAFTPDGVDTSKGYLILGKSAATDFGAGYALSFSFRPKSVDPDAVIMSNGSFPDKGWYLQCKNGSFALMGDVYGGLELPCGPIAPGEWCDFYFSFDGANIEVRVNGKTLHKVRAKRFLNNPDGFDFVIGNYSSPSEKYQFKGQIKNLKAYKGVPSD